MSIQRVLLGDASGVLWFTLWEGDIGRLEVEKTYLLEDVRVKDFLGEKSLSGAEGWNFQEVEDIGAECVGLEVKGKGEAVEKEMKGAVIMGVGGLEKYVKCAMEACRGRVMYADGARIGECCLCHVSQRVLGNLVEVSVELKLVARNGDRVAVDACKDVVELLTGVQACDVTKEHLLFVDSFDGRITNGILRDVKPNGSEDESIAMDDCEGGSSSAKRRRLD